MTELLAHLVVGVAAIPRWLVEAVGVVGIDSTVKWTAIIGLAYLAATQAVNLIFSVLARWDTRAEARQRRVEAQQRTAAEQAAAKAAEAVKVEVTKAKTAAEEVKIVQAQAAQAVAEVAAKLEASTSAVDGKLNGLAQVAKDTHTLVNSNMAVQLKLHAGTSRRLAEITHDPVDIQAADLAEKMVSEHDVK